MKNETPLVTETVPGWYINFLAAVIKQLPRPGQIDQVIAEGWEKNQDALKGKLVESLLPPQVAASQSQVALTEKFVEFKDLGIIEVPAGYVHETHLDSFKQQNESQFTWGYNQNITDANFAEKATVKLMPGRKFRVKVYKQCVSGSTTSEDRMEFLDSKKAVHTGAQGATLVWEQKRTLLPRNYWYCSFDKKGALPVVDRDRRVPDLRVSGDGDFRFDLGNFEGDWDDNDLLLCFCDVESSETQSS